MRKKRHLLMISFDAVADGDVDFLLGLPNFSRLAAQGTLVRDVSSVFVSNTYPAHSSIITGVTPEKHGITENLFFRPGAVNPGWRCQSSLLRVPTLYEKARRQGLTVCSVLYPVTCGAKIRWNFPEIPGESNAARMLFRMVTGGTPGFVLSTVWRSRRHLSYSDESDIDRLSAQAAIGAIRRHKPDLTLLHLLDVDGHKHRYGPQSEEAKAALRRLDGWLGRLMEAQSEAFPGEEPSVIVFSDHGCLPVHTAVDPNDFLRESGLIRAPAKRIGDFDAYFHNAGGTAFLKIFNNAKREEAMQAAEAVLTQPYAKRRLSDSEMKESGLSRDFDFGIEAQDGYSFGEEHLGQHGYSLAREGYHPFYLAAGQGIEKGGTRQGVSIMDICPLAADLLQIPQWEMDGRNRLMGVEK